MSSAHPTRRRPAKPRRRTAGAALLLAGLALAVGAAPGAAHAAEAGRPEARADLLIPGRWLRGATGAGGAWLLTADGPEAPRQLFELRWREARLRTVTSDLPGEAAGLLATAGGEGSLLVQGPGLLLRVDPRGGATAPLPGGHRLLAGGGRRDFTAAPPWLAAARLGEVQAVRPGAGGLEPLATHALPISAERQAWGLRLGSPPLSFAGAWLVVGPRQEGRRVRTLLLGPAGERVESVGLLPEPEQVADQAVVVVDGRPLLVLGTFRGIGVASKKRLRVFALDGRGGDGGAPPILARELPARVWSDLQVATGDLDGDGREDLVVAAAEGFSGEEVTFTAFPGRGEGRLATQPVSASAKVGRASWRLGDLTGDGRPDLVTLAEGRLAVHPGSGASGLPAKRSASAHAFGGSGAPPRRQVTVSVGSGGSRVEQQTSDGATAAAEATAGAADAPGGAAGGAPGGDERDGAPAREGAAPAASEDAGSAGWDLLDLDGDGVLEAVRWEPAAEGRTRLTVVGLAAAG